MARIKVPAQYKTRCGHVFNVEVYNDFWVKIILNTAPRHNFVLVRRDNGAFTENMNTGFDLMERIK